MMNSDQLGAKGEARFRELCEDAQLVCNKSERDRTGWDFIVEFPFDTVSDAGTSLDARKAPLSCHVQVKTLLEKNDTVQMRLSSAERLAKELKPSFIYVLKVNEALQITGAYLIHMSDKPLEKILRRLRKEEAAGNRKPNKSTISLSACKDGKSLEPTGNAFRKEVQTAIGPDLSLYASQKVEQLAKLGFKERPYELLVTLHLDSEDELVDAFLGIKKDIPATNVRGSLTRFGIKLPLDKGAGTTGKISIQPSIADTCSIVVHPNPLSQPAIFRGKVFFPAIPKLPTKRLKMLIETDLFSLTLFDRGWNITTKSSLPPQPPSVWSAYWKLALVMATGGGTIKISLDGRPFQTTLNVPKRTTELDPLLCRTMLDVCEKASALLKLAGVADEPLLSYETIFEQMRDITRVYALTRPELGPHPFSYVTEYTKELAGHSTLDLTYVDFLQIGDTALGYYGLTQVTLQASDDGIEWKSDNVTVMAITELHSFPDNFAEFTQVAAKSTGCDNVYARTPEIVTLESPEKKC